MTKRTRPRRVKARVMWVEESQTDTSRYVLYTTREGALRDSAAGGVTYGPPTPVLLIPRTAAAYDAMVRQLTVALFRDDPEPHWTKGNLEPYYQKLAIAALRAIGITRPKD